MKFGPAIVTSVLVALQCSFVTADTCKISLWRTDESGRRHRLEVKMGDAGSTCEFKVQDTTFKVKLRGTCQPERISGLLPERHHVSYSIHRENPISSILRFGQCYTFWVPGDDWLWA